MKKYTYWIILMGILSFLFGCGSESNYYKKDGKWHYNGVPINRETEPVNFKPLDDYYAKDDQIGYYRGIPIYDGNVGSDGASFEVLNKWYSKDKFRVYFCDTERDSREYWSIRRNKIITISKADPASFQLLSDGYTARDKQHLFLEDKIVRVLDLDSYEILEFGFSRDKVRAYYDSVEIAGSDGSSFVVLDRYYGKDKSTIYYTFYNENLSITIRPLKGVRFESFKVLEDGYATDGTRTYYRGTVVSSQ